MSDSPAVTPNQCKVNAGGGNWYVRSSVVKAYKKMMNNGKCKNTNAAPETKRNNQEGLEVMMHLETNHGYHCRGELYVRPAKRGCIQPKLEPAVPFALRPLPFASP
jgi:hypothetical protein